MVKVNSIDINLISLFDQHLAAACLSYKASIIGGAAILLIANSQRATGDIDSLLKIPKEIKSEILKFARIQKIDESWFNDNASRNYAEFVMKGQEVFSSLVFRGMALQIYTPSAQTLILSKIYPMLDRADTGKDLQDLEALVIAGAISRYDFESALASFKANIRFEDDREIRRASRALASVLNDFIDKSF